MASLVVKITGLLALTACSTPPSPQGGETSPGPEPRFSYSPQPQITNNQSPIGGQVDPIAENPQFALPNGGQANFVFEEIVGNFNRPPTLTIQGIKTQQVFQRSNQNQAQVPFTVSMGTRPARFLRARAVLDNSRQPQTQYLTIDLQATPNAPLILNLVGGAWYRIEVTMHDVNGRIQDMGYSNPFGVGDVYVIAGQSNSTNCGSVATRASSDFVVSTDGVRWQTAHDPQIGTNDAALCQGGSSWSSAGDEFVRQFQVPIAFASTGYSGTSVAEWLPNSGRGLYEFTLQRMRQLGPRGFRAVLWHQGENDVRDATPQQTYADRLLQIIRRSQQDMGWEIPWIVAQASWCRQIPEYNKPNLEPQIIAAQTSLPRSYPFIFSGPNTDVLTEAYRSTNCHFNQQGEIESGRAWTRSIADFLQRNQFGR